MAKYVLSLAAAAARMLPKPVKAAFYKIKPLAQFIRRSLNRAAPHGLTEVSIAAGGLQGLRMSLDLQSEKDYWLGTYEPELQTTVGELAQPGMVVYDVGANIGYISLLLARAVGRQGRVVAFEALPENVERLKTNIALNGWQERVQVVPEAVVDQPGTVQFLVGPSGGMGKVAGSAGRQEITYSETLWVPATSLDAYVYAGKHPAPALIKLDIEGGEVLALPGMRRILQEQRPVLLVELHGPQAASTAWEELRAAGYRVCAMQPGYPEIPALETLDWKAYIVGMPWTSGSPGA